MIKASRLSKNSSMSRVETIPNNLTYKHKRDTMCANLKIKKELHVSEQPSNLKRAISTGTALALAAGIATVSAGGGETPVTQDTAPAVGKAPANTTESLPSDPGDLRIAIDDLLTENHVDVPEEPSRAVPPTTIAPPPTTTMPPVQKNPDIKGPLDTYPLPQEKNPQEDNPPEARPTPPQSTISPPSTYMQPVPEAPFSYEDDEQGDDRIIGAAPTPIQPPAIVQPADQPTYEA
jgi:hypothetical protein